MIRHRGHSNPFSSKQRLLATDALAEPDRVPMDFHGNPWRFKRLHGDLGTAPHRDLLRRLGGDAVDLGGVVNPEYRGPVPVWRTALTGRPTIRYNDRPTSLLRQTERAPRCTNESTA